MDSARLAQIARELPDLLDEQMNVLIGQSLDSLSNSERIAFDKRKGRILQLCAELERLRKAK
jgi:hypothetical protein